MRMKITFWTALLVVELSARAYALPLDSLTLVPRFKTGPTPHQQPGQVVRVGSVSLNLTPLEIPPRVEESDSPRTSGRSQSPSGTTSAILAQLRGLLVSSPRPERAARSPSQSSGSSGSPRPRRWASRSPSTSHRNAGPNRHQSTSPSERPRPWAYLSNVSSPQRGPNSPARRYRPLSQSDIFLPAPPIRGSSSSSLPPGRKKGLWAKLRNAVKGCASCARP